MKLLAFVLSALVFGQLDPKLIPGQKTDKTVKFVYDFPKNEFKNFYSGQEAVIRINMTNTGINTKTVIGLTGKFTKHDTPDVIANISTYPVTKTVKPGKTVALKYKFTPYLEAGQYGLAVLVDFYDLEETGYKQVGAWDAITVSFADSYYDLQSISIYILAALAAYGVFKIFTAPAEGAPLKQKKKAAKPVAQPKVDSDEPQMEWIPDHVIEQTKASPKPRKKKQ
ncbi:hypothetical protein EDD86DRAFT_205053 [Gorgonomyces haynaldii]|nr:hypothetical protein EDD86DRAFT_205053 [Gorgonomyces haynaldii]